MSKHPIRVGISIPPKDPGAKNYNVTGLLPQHVLDELHQRLQEDEMFDVVSDIDMSAAHVTEGKVYAGDLCLSGLDIFFWYHPMPRDRESYDVHVLQALSATTRVLPNMTGLLRGFDKFSSHTALRSAGVSVADYALFRSDQTEEAKRLLKEWGALLLKPSLGKFGQGIVKVESERQMLDVIAYANSYHDAPIEIFAERFEENDITRWISTTIIGDELVFGYRKNPEKFVDGWKVYDENEIGGGAHYVDPAPVAELVLRAREVMGADIIGFDCIYSTTKNAYVIVDENTFPGMYEDCFLEAGKGSWAELFHRLLTRTAATLS